MAAASNARWIVVAILISGGLSGCREQTGYPNRPITLVCPWSVGGGTDRVSRQMAMYLEHELEVPVNVINATGGRGVTGHSRALHARPDGYTIGTITFELNTLHWQDLTKISWQDAEPLMSVNEDAAAIWVRADAEWQTLDDLVQAIREQPGSLTASGTASGGAWHLALAGWLQSIECDPGAIRWIPMGGAGPSLQELISGGIDLVCCSLPEARELYRSGSVRSLGVMAEERVPGFDTIPTMREEGMDWVLVGWRGFAVPVGTPADRVELLATTIQRIVDGEVAINGTTFPDFMQQQGFNNRSRSPDEFRRFLADNDAALGRLITSESFREIGKSTWGPMTWPTTLACIAGVLLLCLAIGRSRRVMNGAIVSRTTADALDDSSAHHPVNALLALSGIVFYLLAAETIGFVLCAGIVLMVLLIKLGTRPLPAIGVVIMFVPLVYGLFAHLMRVPLPRGWIDL